MKKLNVSLIICVADDIRIENILNSINYKCEIVIVLNGCTDKVRKIVYNFRKKTKFDMNIIEIPERNLSKARNIGTINAKYNKTIHYDSDCIIVGDALEKYSKMLDKYLLVDGKVKFKDSNYQSKLVSKLRNMGLPGYALCPSIGINKKIIKNIDYFFDEDIKWIEDSELNNRVHDKNIEIGFIDSITCIHDDLTFKQDLKSAYRYGTGARSAVRKGIRKPGNIGNWFLVGPCFKQSILLGIYDIIWNICFAIGYLIN